ncbi:unnamed protein product [Moneuplotes crassus]|uniref:Uncharacterized protein n=1 Tax=Euplotes crassus TaxID=5936 RepID=A0AAD1X4D8_EUPCR|nr:unnamed protein product [Moneuplotes crassus]
MSKGNLQLKRLVLRKASCSSSVDSKRGFSFSQLPGKDQRNSDLWSPLANSCKPQKQVEFKFDANFTEFLKHNHKSCLQGLNPRVVTYEGLSEMFESRTRQTVKVRARLNKSYSRERLRESRKPIEQKQMVKIEENFELPPVQGLYKYERRGKARHKPSESQNKKIKLKIKSRLRMLKQDFSSKNLFKFPRI